MDNINTQSLNRISKSISELIEDELNNLNLFYRVFYRSKSIDSLSKKLNKKDENGIDKYNESKKIQDCIGIRINLYFADDIDVAYKLFKEKLEFVDETIDKNEATEFKPTRVNLIFKIPKKFKQEFKEIIDDHRIDCTFELQLRTIFSEGWHEVDHDLRYKCEEDWNDHSDIARTFNGILASLETTEWSMIQMFNTLAYRHYKQGNCEAMLRTKFRIRMNPKAVKSEILVIINNDEVLRKKIFRVDRLELLNKLKERPFIIPMNLENLIYIINYYFINDQSLSDLTPELIRNELTT